MSHFMMHSTQAVYIKGIAMEKLQKQSSSLAPQLTLSAFPAELGIYGEMT